MSSLASSRSLKRPRSPSSSSNSSASTPKRQKRNDGNNLSCSVHDSREVLALLRQLQRIQARQNANFQSLQKNHAATQNVLAALQNRHDRLRENHNELLRRNDLARRLAAANAELALQQKTVLARLKRYSSCLAWWGIKLGASRLAGGPLAALAKEGLRRLHS